MEAISYQLELASYTDFMGTTFFLSFIQILQVNWTILKLKVPGLKKPSCQYLISIPFKPWHTATNLAYQNISDWHTATALNFMRTGIIKRTGMQQLS